MDSLLAYSELDLGSGRKRGAATERDHKCWCRIMSRLTGKGGPGLEPRPLAWPRKCQNFLRVSFVGSLDKTMNIQTHIS